MYKSGRVQKKLSSFGHRQTPPGECCVKYVFTAFFLSISQTPTNYPTDRPVINRQTVYHRIQCARDSVQ